MTKEDWQKTKVVIDRLYELKPFDVGLCDGSWLPYAEWREKELITLKFDINKEQSIYIEIEKYEINEKDNVTQEHTDKTTYSFTDLDSAFLKLSELLGGE